MSKYRINADIFKALSNPHRLDLFQRLMSCCAPGTLCNASDDLRFCVGDLGEGLDIAPSTLSHHIKELHRAGLVNMERRGKNVECWVDPDILIQLSEFFSPTTKQTTNPERTKL